jgi:hypothetical protein
MLRRTFIQGSAALALAASTGMLMTVTKAKQAFAATPGGAAQAVVPEHPRLMLHDFEAVRTLVAQDSSAAVWYAKVKADADTIRTLPVSKYEIPDGLRLLSTSREVVRRTYSLAITHALEDDPAYAERLWQELDAVAKFPDWNSQRHFLDTAEMTHAVAIGYDWLYHTWTEAQRAVLRQAIVGFGLNPGMAVYNSGFGWPNGVNNWNIVCNGGLSLGALALAQDEPELSTQILDQALESIPKAIAEYGPDGGYPEGLGSYWGYATKYLVPFVESLKTATGDDHGFSQSPGLDTTGLFPIHLTGPGGENFNYYDAGGGSPQPPEMFWLARTYGNPVFGWWGKLGADKNPVSWFQSPAALLWYDPDLVRSPVQAGLAPDAYFGRCEVVTTRSGWENPKAVFAGFKGGDNATNHGNLDLGTFVLDALGVRWAIELGGDDYNMPGYFSGGPGGQRWTYYRNRGEGQNTLIANPGTGDDQVVRSIGTIAARASGPTAAYAVADLTASNPVLTSWRRGARLFDNRQQLVVQDELTASEPADGRGRPARQGPFAVPGVPRAGGRPGLVPDADHRERRRRERSAEHDGRQPGTRWSADGDGQWIGYDLGSDGPVSSVTIASIGLDLAASVNDSAGTESDIDVMAVDGTFEERTTTWNNRPALGAVLGTTHVSGSAAAWRTVDLTEALRSAVAAGSPITLAVVQNPPEGQNGLAVNIRSRESAQAPRLVIRLAEAE